MWFSVGSAGSGQYVTDSVLVSVAWVHMVQDCVKLWFKCKAYVSGSMALHWCSCVSVCGSNVRHIGVG